MLRRIGKYLGLFVGAALVIAAGLYVAGMRVVMYGGGAPRLRFITPPDKHAEDVARHREAQRAQSGPAVPSPAPASAENAAPAADRSAPADPAAKTAASAAPRGSSYWTNFRGPERDGAYRQQPVATTWPAGGPKMLWKQPVGGGYASFVIARGRAFTIEQRGDEEVAAAYDVLTGRELWINTWTATFRESMGGDGPRATPTWADGRLYTLGGTGELRCLDEATGRVIWRTNILRDAGANNLPWGMAASPLIVDNTVVVLPGGSGGRSVMAYDRETGRPAWSALSDQQSYSSPMLVTLAGVRQILVFSALRLIGMTPDSGDLLWEYPWKTAYDVNASQPLLVGDNRVFLSTGYGTGAVLVEITKDERGFSVREVWRTNRMKNQFSSSLLHDGFIYGLDESILACIDAATGELKWKGGRYGYGQVMLASDHLIVLTESGELALVRATPERHHELARVPAIDGKTWNHPAMSDGILIVRNINEMAAFDLRSSAR